MKATTNSTRRIFLILFFVCAFFVSITQVQARDNGSGRLIVQRSANFGTDVTLQLWIDDRQVNINRGRRYDRFISPGRHVLTATSIPNIQSNEPTSTVLIVQPGRTYIFTAGWTPDNRVILRRSTLAL